MGIGSSLATLINLAFEIYIWIVIARVLISWVSPDPYNPVVRFLHQASEPVLAPCRRLLPSLGGFDLSPILAILALSVVQRLLVSLLSGHGLGGVLQDVLVVIHLLLTLYMLLMVMRAGMTIYSWITFRRGRLSRLNFSNPATRFIFMLTDPLVRPLQKVAPVILGLNTASILLSVALLLVLLGLQELSLAIAHGGLPSLGSGGATSEQQGFGGGMMRQ